LNRLILHHYPNSPFAEKIRLILGFKSLHWTGVNIPTVMPKPDVIALTGGYRKTPILQIGADIYCDTALIADVIEALAPSPTLYPKAAAATRTLAQWADSTLFWTAIPFTLQPAGLAHMFSGVPPETLQAFIDDRSAFRANLPRMRAPEARAALGLYLGRLDETIGGQTFLFGAQPSIADFSVYHCLWFILRGGATAQVLEPFHRIEAWRERMRAFGHGTHDELDSGAAVALAREAAPLASAGLSADTHGFAFGEKVVVAATDTGTEPIEGDLYAVTADRVSITREDRRAT
jgi:glutathione S-transferase